MSAAATAPGGSRRRVAVAASARYPDLREDWPIQRDAMAALGLDATTAVWTDREVRWDEYDLVVANGAWDNIHRPTEFLEWVDLVADTGVPIVNSPATLRWNIDKRYLGDLAAAEVMYGPTAYARVDLVRLEDGSPAVLELELLDPALFFEHHPEGARHFASVLRDRIQAG